MIGVSILSDNERRLKKWVNKRADIRNKNLWKTTKNISQKPSYEHGFMDAMNQVKWFIEYLETPPPPNLKDENT